MRNLLKGSLAALFSMMLMLSTVVPVLGAEPSTPQISGWAVNELSEGEKYGIFPLDWYYDGFREEISPERLEVLFSKTEGKISALKLEKNESYTPIKVTSKNTRGNIINGLYHIVAQYDVPVGNSAVSYMQERGIIKGNGNGLKLGHKATTEEAILFATRLIKDTYAQVGAGAKGVAWKVENDGNIVYLLGSIHVGTPELYPFNEELLTAFHESDTLYAEVDFFDQEGMQYFTEVSMFQDGKTIKDAVSEETYQKLLQVFEKYEQPAEAFMEMKPWSLASYLSNLSLSESTGIPADVMANSGIDMYFMTNAMLTGKPIKALEGMKMQADMIDGLTSEAQEVYLAEVLDNILNPELQKEEADMIHLWFDKWITGDIDGFAESFNSTESGSTEFNEMLLGQRDIDMAEKISGLLESEEKGASFVVVGAGHFLTEESILYHLEAKRLQGGEFLRVRPL